jgi:hypothetical protein
MNEKQAVRIFGWSLGGLYFALLALNAVAR